MSDLTDTLPSEPKLLPIALTILVTVFIIVLFFGYSAYYFSGKASEELNSKEITEKSTDLTQLRVYEDELLNQLKWRDKSKGLVKIPITMAMEKIVEKYQK
ncbi:MAG: hypothetical protein HRT90_02900 [Candidatus Margulisbacteria bacterium]|nr:hypothetical protein [Candidatus Margulisiibacteriota bacterium]